MTDRLRTVAQTRGADTLLVLLPGAYMAAEDYAARFFPAVERRGMKLDLVAVDLGLDAVSAGDALPAVLEQILRPARQTHRHVWLGGISLGGLLALGLTADHPDAIDGLCLIAPYPGSRLTTNAIARTGGLDVWQATDEQLLDPEFRIYRWLKSPPPELPVFVGHGREDRFACRHAGHCRPLSAGLPLRRSRRSRLAGLVQFVGTFSGFRPPSTLMPA